MNGVFCACLIQWIQQNSLCFPSLGKETQCIYLHTMLPFSTKSALQNSLSLPKKMFFFPRTKALGCYNITAMGCPFQATWKEGHSTLQQWCSTLRPHKPDWALRPSAAPSLPCALGLVPWGLAPPPPPLHVLGLGPRELALPPPTPFTSQLDPGVWHCFFLPPHARIGPWGPALP